MTAAHLRDHRRADPRPVRIPDHILQAGAFLAMFGRLHGAPDLEMEFLAWCESKDFSDCNRQAIEGELRRVLPGRTGGTVRWPGP